MKLLAIDGSTKATGIAIFDNNKLIYYKCLIENKDDVKQRILNMVQKVKQIYLEYKPDKIVMQQVLPQDVNHNNNVYKSLIYLQAYLVLTLWSFGGRVDFCTASHWRKLVGIQIGRGIRRDELKAASQKLVKNLYQIDVNDDISDAICLGVAYILENKRS